VPSSRRSFQPQYLDEHLRNARAALEELGTHLTELDVWSCWLADALGAGGRLLVAGNGGSAALAGHLAAELVGRFRGERPAFSALALHEAATLTAIGNDYGYEESFARQVDAHGRDGDVLLALSTSGRSANLVRATERAQDLGVAAWALTGPAPNPLSDRADDVIALDAPNAAAVQEAQQVAVHLLCVGFEHHLSRLAVATLSLRRFGGATAACRTDDSPASSWSGR
jgi:phosphoheptose isomerase